MPHFLPPPVLTVYLSCARLTSCGRLCLLCTSPVRLSLPAAACTYCVPVLCASHSLLPPSVLAACLSCDFLPQPVVAAFLSCALLTSCRRLCLLCTSPVRVSLPAAACTCCIPVLCASHFLSPPSVLAACISCDFLPQLILAAFLSCALLMPCAVACVPFIFTTLGIGTSSYSGPQHMLSAQQKVCQIH